LQPDSVGPAKELAPPASNPTERERSRIESQRREERRTARWERRAKGGVLKVLQESMRLRRGVKVADHGFEDSVRIQINW